MTLHTLVSGVGGQDSADYISQTPLTAASYGDPSIGGTRGSLEVGRREKHFLSLLLVRVALVKVANLSLQLFL